MPGSFIWKHLFSKALLSSHSASEQCRLHAFQAGILCCVCDTLHCAGARFCFAGRQGGRSAGQKSTQVMHIVSVSVGRPLFSVTHVAESPPHSSPACDLRLVRPSMTSEQARDLTVTKRRSCDIRAAERMVAKGLTLSYKRNKLTSEQLSECKPRGLMFSGKLCHQRVGHMLLVNRCSLAVRSEAVSQEVPR